MQDGAWELSEVIEPETGNKILIIVAVCSS